ncbi:hypothetical protein [Pedobacter cryotolerans]|nr:hypothetical protein [Pedobacter cryotolerans]
MISCNTENYPYSDEETEQFLNEVVKNAKATITDLTEIDRKPADKFGILTRYTLSKKDQDEYHKNNGTIVNKDGNIYDFNTYNLKDYQLKNEKNEVLKFVDNGAAKTLQGLPFGEYENVLCRNLGIMFNLNKKFEKLNGFINIEFEMSNGMKKEVKIPVNISINDKVPD